MNNARNLIHMPPIFSNPYTGKGVGIAFLDTGIFPHIDFTEPYSRIAAFRDFVNLKPFPYDDNGHGTHICGISSGSGKASRFKYTGVAPGSHLIVGKVLDNEGNGSISAVLEGIQWVIENKDAFHIRILNISIGAEVNQDITEDSVLVKCVNEAWDQGITVVVAAGNNGPKPMSVTAPGISRKVITVGSSDDTNYIYLHGEKISNYSGRGPTKACIIKPDVVAPGSNIMSCYHKKSFGQYTYAYRSGTSMSTPIVSGAIALLLEKYPSMTNKGVKLRLMESCDDLGFSKYQQGWGQLNVERLLI